MINHLHIILHIDIYRDNDWSDREVVKRWHKLFNGTPLSQRFLDGELLSEGEALTLRKTIAEYRCRLSDISWFMRCLNEPIARMANEEDEYTGHLYSPPSMALTLRAA